MNDVFLSFSPPVQKPANILVMGEGPERGRVKIGMTSHTLSYFILYVMNKTLLEECCYSKTTDDGVTVFI